MADDLTKESLLRDTHHAWDEFRAYIGSLSEAQLTQPTDASGWTAKDHIAHIYEWENAIHAMLDGKSTAEVLNVPAEDLKNHDFDAVNEILRQRHLEKSPAEVFSLLDTRHAQTVQRLEAWDDADLQKPFKTYHPNSKSTYRLIEHIIGDAYLHYQEHLPWIKAIVDEA